MRSEEVKTSKKYAKQLTFGAKTYDPIKGVTTAYFTDSDNTPWIHYQVDPDRAANDKAAARAKTFLTKLNKLNSGDKVFCYGRIRLMENGECYRDVEEIVNKM